MFNVAMSFCVKIRFLITLLVLSFCCSYCFEYQQPEGLKSAKSYLFEGSQYGSTSGHQCDNFYRAVCNSYEKNFANESFRYDVMTTETRIMAGMIEEFGKILEHYSTVKTRDPKFRLKPFQIDLLEHYQQCKTQPIRNFCDIPYFAENQDDHSQLPLPPILESRDYSNYRSFEELSHSAQCYLKNWTKSDYCAYQTMQTFHSASAHLYISHLFGWKKAWNLKLSTNYIVFQIKTALTSIFLAQKWMDWEAKRRVIHDIEHLNVEIGFPAWLRNEDRIESCRRIYPIRKNLTSQYPYECQKPVLSTDALFDSRIFTLFIPFGCLLKPFYHPEYPSNFRFGILGHKIAESIVRVLLRNSNVRHSRNCEKKTLRDKAQSANSIFLLLQRNFQGDFNYAQTNFGDHQLKTAWNFAAFAGLKATLLAYRQHALSKDIANPLPDLNNVSDEQMLIAAYARSQCAYISKSAIYRFTNPDRYQNYYGERTPTPTKVQAATMLLEEFKFIFRCEKFSVYSEITKNVLD